VACKKVWASQGKYARAEPISALYEKGLIHHVGMFATLEDQLCNWVPGEGFPSPNELDAAVWALSELCLEPQIPHVDLSRILGDTKASSLPPDARQTRRERFADAAPGRVDPHDRLAKLWGITPSYDDEDYT
jgi:hypothetical protein